MFGSWLRRLLGMRGESAVPALERYTAPRPLVNQQSGLDDANASVDLPIDLEADMREYIRREIWGGYSDRAGAIDFGIEMFADQADPALLRPISERLVNEALADHAREAATWPEVTDYDRLVAAFGSLERDGIVARQNFTCCGSCGAAEIWDEIEAADAKGGRSRGYAFFHMQDTENAADGGGLYLNYGACADGEAAALGVAHEIVAHLEKAGLKTEWDGKFQCRIGVSIDWKRRRQD